jgi:integrase
VDVKEKGILTQEEVKTLVNTGSGNADARLATLLGCLCGLRLGEVRGLHWEDIKDGAINVRRNWQDAEGLKAPKYDSFRTVPLPSAAAQLLGGTGRKESGFVLLGQDGRKPPSITTVRKRFIADLASIGISREEQKRRNITFHSMRHTFVTLCRMAEISVLETQVFAGHRRGTQTEHYSHGKQMTDLEASRSKIETIIGITA